MLVDIVCQCGERASLDINTLSQHPLCQRCGKDLSSYFASTATHILDETSFFQEQEQRDQEQQEQEEVEDIGNTTYDALANTNPYIPKAVDDEFDLDRTVESKMFPTKPDPLESTLTELRLPQDKTDISLSSDVGKNIRSQSGKNSDSNRAPGSQITLDLQSGKLFENQATHAERLLNADPSYRIARAKKAREQAGDAKHSNDYVYGIHRIIRSHVKGGMGMVHIAYDQFLKREVALKELFKESTIDESIVHRFIVEAEITAQLEHPGIVPIHSLGLDLNGNPYYTMKLIRGRTLQEAIKLYFKEPNEAELKRLIRRFVSVCKTMEFAHQKGVIHRDLKPANIMLSEHGETLVMDWGIAKVYDADVAIGTVGTSVSLSQPTRGNSSIRPTTRSASKALELTLVGTVVGTPAFMSPEQASPESNFVGPLSDVFSLGAILFYLLTGRNAYTGKSSQEVLTKVLTTNPPKPSEVARNIPPGLEAICMKAMSRNPKSRYQSAAELDADLCNWLDGEPISAMKETASEKLWRFTRKNRQISMGVFFVLLILFLALTALVVFLDRHQRQRSFQNTESQVISQRIEEIDKEIPILEQKAKNAKEECDKSRNQYASTTHPELKTRFQDQINIHLGEAAKLDAQIEHMIQLRTELRALNQSILQSK